jgi:hypothetical protein
MSATDFDWNDLESFGQAISGLRVDDSRFVAVMPFSRLEQLVKDPQAAANARFRETSGLLEQYYELHEEIQRAFDAGKKKNAEDYAHYVVKLANGQPGDTPTIDLYTPRALPVSTRGPDQKAQLAWPFDLICVPYDGETQLAARFRAARLDAKTRGMVVIVTITHGKSVEHAKQCFHDRNVFQRRASASVAMAMDTQDPLIAVVHAIEARVPEAKDAIAWQSRQVPNKGGFIAAASFVRTAVACFAQGIAGVQATKGEVPGNLTATEFERRALLWFSRVIPTLAPYMKDRERYVASSPAIWAAVGALGHDLVDLAVTDNGVLNSMADGLAAKLASIRWEKSDNWVGIAVKSTPTGGYSFAGGAKDSGTIAFKALRI